MLYSSPSPSDSCSNWSSCFSDCDTSTTSTSTVCTTRGSYELLGTPTTQYGVLPEKPHWKQICVTGAFTTALTPKAESEAGRSPQNAKSTKAATRLGRYAKEDDWVRHRERITSLYKAKRLKDVMAIMESEHSFVATERMYKARFKDWGLGKNVTAAEVHRLMQRVEQQKRHDQAQQGHHQRRSTSVGRSAGDIEMVMLDVGDDLDVKRIQKYMKRKPKGLDKLRTDPKRPLDVLKILSVDGGKETSGRAKVSSSAGKLEKQVHYHTSMPSPNLDLPWSSESELPDEITRLLQTFVDTCFREPYPYTCCPTMPYTTFSSPEWQSQAHGHSSHSHSSHSHSVDSIVSSYDSVSGSSQSELMLDFVLKFRIAHIFLDEGLTQQGFEIVNLWLKSLALHLRQALEATTMSSRLTTTVLLYALSAALEVAVDFNHPEVMYMLFQHVEVVCAGQQPVMAEIARQMSQLGSSGDQVAALKLARQMIIGSVFAGPGDMDPAFEMYSRSVDVVVSQASPEDRLHSLHAIAAEPCVQRSGLMGAWMEMRTALEARPSAQLQNCYRAELCGALTFPSWQAHGNKIAAVFGYVFGRVDYHKGAGNWQGAQKLAAEAAWMAEAAWGYENELSRKFREEAEALRSPEQVPCSLPQLEHMHMLLPLPETNFHLQQQHVSDSSGWEQNGGQGWPLPPQRPPPVPLWLCDSSY